MKGDSKELLKFMEGSDTRFIIPVYQRNYDWKKENCAQLINDLFKVVEEKRASHFFGSIVSVSEGSNKIIIDGQQRLTTVNLIMLALRNLISEGLVSADDPQLADRITDDYLVDRWKPDDKKIKLKPVKDDQKAFNRLFTDPADPIVSSKVTQNYRFFYSVIKEKGVSGDELFSALKKLIVIDIALEGGDNPQLIFESLNSTGLDLSEADKIRNFVLMGLPAAAQEQYYLNYWNRIEELTGYAVSEFIRQYLTFKSSKWPIISRVYQSFKDFASGQDIELLLADMLEYAKVFSGIAGGSCGDYDCDMTLKRLSRLEMSVANPFLFDVIGQFRRNELGVEQLRKVLFTVEVYVYRRLVCEVPTNSLNKTFANLGNEARRVAGSEGDFAEAVAFSLLRRTGTTRFPSDEEFELCVRSRDFYNMRPKNRIYTFDRLENGSTYERVNVPGMMLQEKHGLSIEHVMPQVLTESWRRDLGPDYARIHVKWVHRIANLTLTAYNSKYSNSPFKEKLEMANGFRDSHLWLNGWIKQQSAWAEEQMMAREDRMVSRFLELWPLPQSDIQPASETESEHGLDEGFDFTGAKVASYTFLGSKHYHKTWKDAAEAILREVYDLEPATMMLLSEKEEFTGSYFASGKQGEKGWFSIGDDLYVYLATSTSCKMAVIEAALEAVGLSVADLSFAIRPESEGVQLSLEG